MWGVTIVVAICIHCTVSQDLVITPVVGPPTNLTGYIFWNPTDDSIYYSDFYTYGTEPSIYRYDYKKNTVHGAYIEGKELIAYLLPARQCGNVFDIISYHNNLFMAGAQHDNFLIDWDGCEPVAKVIRTVFRIEENYPSSHMDVSGQNYRGQFFGGTTTDQYCGGSSNSSLYTYSRWTGVRKIATGFQSTAGLNFFYDTIYQTDVCTQKITEIKKDLFGNYVQRVVFDFAVQGKANEMPLYTVQAKSKVKYSTEVVNVVPIVDATTRPSGLEVDCDGNLYVVGYVNGKVWRINPKTSTGEVILTLPYFLTGVAFGGPNRDILFVLTSSALVQAWPLKVLVYKAAPPLFMVSGLGARGVPAERLQC